MSRFAAIDLSSLPTPDVIETIDYETILAALKADFLTRYTDYSASDLESDPVAKLLETAAYREVTLRQRVNDAARARNLVYAEDADLEALAADQGVYRLTLTEADETTGTAATYEEDDDLRRRTQLAPEALTTAGSEGSYVFNALTAGSTPVSITVASASSSTVTLTYTFDSTSVSAKIKDATATRPEPGSVLVTILGRTGDGSVDADTIATVQANLSSKSVRPLCDEVTVQGAEILSYAVSATLTVYDGLDQDTVEAAALAAMQSVANTRHALGEAVTSSVVDAGLHVSGVKTVTLSDWTDKVCDDTQAPYCTGITLTSVAASAEDASS